MKLLPFNLERALAGDQLVTRDKQEATELTKFNTAGNYTLAAVINGQIRSFDENGMFIDACDESRFDLFMVAPEPVKKTYWINVYSSFPDPILGSPFSDLSKAQEAALYHDDFIKTISFEVEE